METAGARRDGPARRSGDARRVRRHRRIDDRSARHHEAYRCAAPFPMRSLQSEVARTVSETSAPQPLCERTRPAWASACELLAETIVGDASSSTRSAQRSMPSSGYASPNRRSRSPWRARDMRCAWTSSSQSSGSPTTSRFPASARSACPDAPKARAQLTLRFSRPSSRGCEGVRCSIGGFDAAFAPHALEKRR